jgi:hypothetical protein
MSAKVVRTTVLELWRPPGRFPLGDWQLGTVVTVLPAADFDAMVTMLRRAAGRCDGCKGRDYSDEHWPECLTSVIRAFMAETKGET